MKALKEIKSILEVLKPLISEQYGVETLGVFGSYTRGEQTKKSDIDILVTFREDAHPGLFEFLDLEEFLAKKLGLKVDLVSKDALKPYIGKRILEEVVMV
jgi:predicted nucleotidyltransferase